MGDLLEAGAIVVLFRLAEWLEVGFRVLGFRV